MPDEKPDIEVKALDAAGTKWVAIVKGRKGRVACEGRSEKEVIDKAGDVVRDRER